MSNVFKDLDLQRAIDLRWTLRDIRSKRWKLSPINSGHLEKLIEKGLVEIREDDNPVLPTLAWMRLLEPLV